MSDDRKRASTTPPTPCALCAYPFDQEACGPQGCPNCHGEGLDEPPAVLVTGLTGGKPSADAIRERMRGHVAPPLDIPPLAGPGWPDTVSVDDVMAGHLPPYQTDDANLDADRKRRARADRKARNRAAQVEAGCRQVSVVLSPAAVAALDTLCAEQGTTATAVIAQALADAMVAAMHPDP